MFRQRKNEAFTTIASDFSHIGMGDSPESVLGKVQAIPLGHVGSPGIFVWASSPGFCQRFSKSRFMLLIGLGIMSWNPLKSP